MSKGGGSQTSTVANRPADFIAPYLSEASGEAQDLYKNFRPEFFPGSTYVPYSPETELALTAQTNRAISGSPLTQAAQDQALKTIQGDYLSNPYLQPVLDQQYGKIAGNINSQFATRGGYGGSANQEVLAREQMKAANEANLQNYQFERGNQVNAINNSGNMAAQDYNEIAALRDVGTMREDLFGRQLQNEMDRFNFEQGTDSQALDDYIRRLTALSGNFGVQTTTQPKAGQSVLGNIAGLAQLGMGAYGMFAPGMGLTGGLDPFSGITWNSGRLA